MQRLEPLSPPASDLWSWRFRDDEGVVFGLGTDHNILVDSFELPFDDILKGVAAVIRTGWLDGPETPTDGVFFAGFRTWTQAGRDRYDAVLPDLCTQANAVRREIWLWPHARHVLGDAQRVLAEARSWDDATPLRVLLEPAALLTPAMLDAAEDHLHRAVDALAAHPRTACVLISDVELVEPDPTTKPEGTPPGPELRSVTPGRGVLGAAALEKLARAAETAGARIVQYEPKPGP